MLQIAQQPRREIDMPADEIAFEIKRLGQRGGDYHFTAATRYKMEAPLFIPPNVKVFGNGSILDFSKCAIPSPSDITKAWVETYGSVSNLRIVGPHDGQPVGVRDIREQTRLMHGIQVKGSDIHLHDLNVDHVNGFGFHFTSAEHVLAERCLAQLTGCDGFHIYARDDKMSGYITLQNCAALSTGDDGFAVNGRGPVRQDGKYLVEHWHQWTGPIRLLGCTSLPNFLRQRNPAPGRAFCLLGARCVTIANCHGGPVEQCNCLLVDSTDCVLSGNTWDAPGSIPNTSGDNAWRYQTGEYPGVGIFRRWGPVDAWNNNVSGLGTSIFFGLPPNRQVLSRDTTQPWSAKGL